MDPLFLNKIAGGIFAAILVVMFATTVSETIFHAEGPEKVAYPVTVEVAATEETPEEEAPGVTFLLASASVDKGERQFAKCKSCHSIDKGGRNATGPNLYGVVGADIASVDGYRYSSSLQEAGGDWTYDALDAWLANPNKFISGNKMSFAGLRRPDQRADLIAYLRSFHDAPPALPDPSTGDEDGVVNEALGATD